MRPQGLRELERTREAAEIKQGDWRWPGRVPSVTMWVAAVSFSAGATWAGSM